MTLTTRNRFLTGGIVLSLIPLVSLFTVLKEALSHSDATLAAATARSAGLLQTATAMAMAPSAHIPIYSIIFASVYAVAILVLLYYLFEKTQSPEILFFALFVLSFSGEFLRLTQPIALARSWPPAFCIASERALIFCHFFGMFSLFASSLFACGIDFQKHGYILIIMLVTALSIATGIPADDQAWYSNFAQISGYSSMMTMTGYAITALTCASYLMAAHTRGANEFLAIALGAALLFIGWEGLVTADNILTLALGLGALALGTWLFLSRLHRYYLWL